jgi:hypothetical protein
VAVRFDKRVAAGLLCCLAAVMTAGCELDNAGVPRIIPGPSVPSPVPLHPPYVWDTREELVVWTENMVSRGSFSIDSDDSNGAIVIQLAGTSGGMLLLRGPDLEPPAAIRAARLRYQWLPDGSTNPLSLRVSFDAANPPTADVQPQLLATLKAGSAWQEIEVNHVPSLDVRYVYFWTFAPGVGRLRIDAITLVS